MNNNLIKKNTEGLIAPLSYLNANKNELEKQLNGCGPSSLPPWIVPESLIGVNVTESCYIHDWMYHEASTNEDFKNADTVFLKNMNKQVENKDSPFNFVRKAISYLYYTAVRIYSTLKFNLLDSQKG